MPQTATSLESTVRLPQAIVRQSQRVAELEAARAEGPPSDPTNQEAPAPPIAEPVASPVPADFDPGPATPTAAEDEWIKRHQSHPRFDDIEYWRQRAKVLAGLFEKERKDRSADQDRQEEQLREIREQLRTNQQQQPASPSKIDVSSYFTPEQIEQYGEDQCRTLAEVASRAAREQVQAAVQAELQPIRESQTNAAERDKRAKQQAFISALAAHVPDYESVDATDGWKLWLTEEDPASGIQRQELLNRHVNAGNAPMVARLFDAYKATLASPAAPPIAPANRAGPPAAPPVQQVAARGYPSKDEIRDFYKRAAIGKVKEQERADFEARLQLRPLAA